MIVITVFLVCVHLFAYIQPFLVYFLPLSLKLLTFISLTSAGLVDSFSCTRSLIDVVALSFAYLSFSSLLVLAALLILLFFFQYTCLPLISRCSLSHSFFFLLDCYFMLLFYLDWLLFLSVAIVACHREVCCYCESCICHRGPIFLLCALSIEFLNMCRTTHAHGSFYPCCCFLAPVHVASAFSWILLHHLASTKLFLLYCSVAIV